ncbi:MAG: TATA box-binding protein, partial [Thaumarchaeota archaeon]|nr:TATA box-binding protein [Nitrososphaerota archaeon]
QFPGLVMKSTNPKSSILIFRSGKIVCTGTKQEQFAKKAIKNMHNFLNSLGFKTKENPIMIQNIVASVNLRNKIKLEQTAKVLPRSMYEPEQFPGIIHRVVTPASTVLLFASGKMVCVGTKSMDNLGKVVHNIVFELRKNKLYA